MSSLIRHSQYAVGFALMLGTVACMSDLSVGMSEALPEDELGDPIGARPRDAGRRDGGRDAGYDWLDDSDSPWLDDDDDAGLVTQPGCEPEECDALGSPPLNCSRPPQCSRDGTDTCRWQDCTPVILINPVPEPPMTPGARPNDTGPRNTGRTGEQPPESTPAPAPTPPPGAPPAAAPVTPPVNQPGAVTPGGVAPSAAPVTAGAPATPPPQPGDVGTFGDPSGTAPVMPPAGAPRPSPPQSPRPDGRRGVVGGTTAVTPNNGVGINAAPSPDAGAPGRDSDAGVPDAAVDAGTQDAGG